MNRLEKVRNKDGHTGELPPFIFMGDDDNDVEIATESTYAFFAKPCSAGEYKGIYLYCYNFLDSTLSFMSTAMYAFVQSVKYGQTLKVTEANHLGIVGTVEILEHAINALNGLLGVDEKKDMGEKREEANSSKRKRTSTISSSSRRRERLVEFTPPVPPLSIEQEETYSSMETSQVQQPEPIPQADVQVAVKSPLENMIAYFKKPKWAICMILVTVIALLPV